MVKKATTGDFAAFGRKIFKSNDSSNDCSFDGLSKEIISLILSFAYGGTPSATLTLWPDRRSFFVEFFYLSKTIQKYAIYFLQDRIRLLANNADFAVMCKYGGSPTAINYTVSSNYHKAVLLHTLKTCDLIALKSVALEFKGSPSQNFETKLVGGSRCIPLSTFKTVLDQSQKDYQLCIAGLLKKRGAQIEEMTVASRNGPISWELFDNFYSSLKTIRIISNRQLFFLRDDKPLYPPETDGLKCIKSISKMHRLRNCSICKVGRGKMKSELFDNTIGEISSNSLLELKFSCRLINFQKLHCPLLKKLFIEDAQMNFDTKYPAFDNICPSSLELLSLDLQAENGYNEEVFQQLSSTIKALPNLKVLRISDDKKFVYPLPPIQFEISSDSLEEIEMKGDHIKVTKCLCPSLHLFSFYGGALSYSSNQLTPSNLQDIYVNTIKTVVEPQQQFCKEDFGIQSAMEIGYHEHSFCVKERPFVGMTVSENCVVKVGIEYAFHMNDPFMYYTGFLVSHGDEDFRTFNPRGWYQY